MTWDRSKPWTAPAKTLVLYRTKQSWRFAVYNEAGVMDGTLRDIATDDADVAQAHLVDRVTADTGLRYVVHWHEKEPGWWTAELEVAAE